MGDSLSYLDNLLVICICIRTIGNPAKLYMRDSTFSGFIAKSSHHCIMIRLRQLMEDSLEKPSFPPFAYISESYTGEDHFYTAGFRSY